MQGKEFLVSEIRNKKECQKSKLREAMPLPRFPDKFMYLGTEKVGDLIPRIPVPGKFVHNWVQSGHIALSHWALTFCGTGFCS